ncbi:MAG TPA: hypothetical protein VFM05_03645, partial [Candidatus Saccharimonadales bacterium]|nr:hypothetical protein [Candidatus Saccharimonadales bacterium]
VKKGVNLLITTLWRSLSEWWIMREPPFLEVLSLADGGDQWNDEPKKEAYLDLDKYLKTQARLPSTNLHLGVFIRGKHQRRLYGQKLNLDLIDETDKLGARNNGTLIPGKPLRIRLANERLIQKGYSAVTCTMSIAPQEKFGLQNFEFRYHVFGTKIAGQSLIKISTGSRP